MKTKDLENDSLYGDGLALDSFGLSVAPAEVGRDSGDINFISPASWLDAEAVQRLSDWLGRNGETECARDRNSVLNVEYCVLSDC